MSSTTRLNIIPYDDQDHRLNIAIAVDSKALIKDLHALVSLYLAEEVHSWAPNAPNMNKISKGIVVELDRFEADVSLYNLYAAPNADISLHIRPVPGNFMLSFGVRPDVLAQLKDQGAHGTNSAEPPSAASAEPQSAAKHPVLALNGWRGDLSQFLGKLMREFPKELNMAHQHGQDYF